ncbi:sugar nucleotide-binding protein [bacterium]|nr:sugar nucleotide-binding protein [bacterium]
MYLIVGGDSLIGGALANYWSERGVSYHMSTRRSERVAGDRPFIDLSNPESFSLTQKYDGAVLCAAASRLAACEEHPEETYRINVTGTCAIAQELERAGTFILFLSTSQVFDGSKPFRFPEEPTCPVNQYGKQKSEAERRVLELQNSAVLRIAKVIYDGFPLFVEWQRKLSSGQAIKAYRNYFFAPIQLDSVVCEIDRVIRAKCPGIHHTPSCEDVSYYEYALNLGRLLNADLALIEGVDVEFNFDYCRYTSLRS